MKKSLIVFFFLLFSCTAFAGISSKEKDTFKLIGTSFAYNGKFAWIELNGEDYGWLREGRRIGDYLIVRVEMGKVKLVLFGQELELKMLPEDTQ